MPLWTCLYSDDHCPIRGECMGRECSSHPQHDELLGERIDDLREKNSVLEKKLADAKKKLAKKGKKK